MAELQAEPKLNEQEITLLLQTARNMMAENRYQEAADILEKILMISSATDDVIDEYQQALKAIEQQILDSGSQAHETGDWNVHGKLGVNLGGGNNLNRAPADKNIKITLLDGSALLELSKEQQPQGGYGVETNASIWGATKLTSTDSINLALQIQHRTTDKKNFTDYLRVNAGGSAQHKLKNNDELGIAIFADVLQYDNEARFYSLDLISRYAWQNNQDCHSQVGFDMQWKHQKDQQLFDSIYSGASAMASCYWLGGTYNLGLSAGNEWALDDQRPGGGQWRLRAQLSHDREVNWLRSKDRINSYVNLEYMHDQHGYSPLLENGLKRNINRFVVGGQYRYPMAYKKNQWWAVMKTEWQKQYSNIQLFEFDALEVWLGVEVLW